MQTARLGAALQHRGVRWIGVGWAGFITENLVLSHNREEIIGAVGDGAYHTVYSGLSTAACASIGYGYMKLGQGPKIWSGGGRLPKAGALALQTLGLVGISQMLPSLQVPVAMKPVVGEQEQERAQAKVAVATMPGPAAAAEPAQAWAWKPRCPIDFKPYDVPEDGVHGVNRVSRHPGLWALGAASLGTALATPFAAEVLFFTMPAVFALIGGAHQDYRQRRSGELADDTYAATSNVPFLALLSGRQDWAALYQEVKPLNATLGATVAVVLAARRGLVPINLLRGGRP